MEAKRTETKQVVQLEQVQRAFDSLREVKDIFAKRGWFPATSGNLSVRVPSDAPREDSVIAVTASGKDKAAHTPEDFLLVDLNGDPVSPTRLKPSAETLIHTAVYQDVADSEAVFHCHTMYNNLISEWYGNDGQITFSRHELIKAFNIWEEDAVIAVPIVENYADIPTLAEAVRGVIHPRVPGVLIRNHGIYVWGNSAFAAKRHLEAFEFLFEYHIRLLQLRAQLR